MRSIFSNNSCNEIALFGVAADQSNTSQSLPAASNTHIKLIHLPIVDRPTEFGSAEKFLGDYIENYKNHVKETILNQVVPNTSQIAGVIVDMFCTTMIDIAHELEVPSFVFFASGAAFLGFLLYLPKRYDQVGKVFDESDSDSIIPSYINPASSHRLMHCLDLPSTINAGYISFANPARRFRETKGIIINTLLELESHAVHSLFDSTQNDQSQPQQHVYAVSPLIDIKGKYQVKSDPTKVDNIMKWLDDQPPRSVVFLCFGSFGSFDETQLKGMAIGLEQSGQRFLWFVRQKPPKGTMEMPGEHTNYENFLPQGFLERTKGHYHKTGQKPPFSMVSIGPKDTFVWCE